MKPRSSRRGDKLFEMKHLPVLAGLALFASLCSAACTDQGWYLVNPETHSSFEVGPQAMAGMTGEPAAYIRTAKGGDASGAQYGTLERSLPLDGFQGKRLRVAFRLRNEGDVAAFAGAEIQKPHGNGIAAATQENPPGNASWQPHRFVLDVPDDAEALVVRIELTGAGAVWLDGLKLETVGSDVAVSQSFPTFSVAHSAPARRNRPNDDWWLCCSGEQTPSVPYGGQIMAPSSATGGRASW